MANKVDIAEEDPSLRQVTIEEAQKFAEYNNLLFMGETSAKDNKNIKETFEGLLCQVHWCQRVVQEQKKYEALKLGQKTIHYDNDLNKTDRCNCGWAVNELKGREIQ